MKDIQLDGSPALLIGPEDCAVLGEESFGMPGLRATELLGPFVRLHASGPLITVHDAVMEPGMGIGHHPHRFNERLFYILEGAIDHDDALNGITGHMGKGDLGRLTEGQRGMLHQEWNNTDVPARAFILVYETDPVPPVASFALLPDDKAPRYQEAPGIHSKELVGPRARFPLHGDIRLMVDTRLEAGATLSQAVSAGEGALLFPLEGEMEAPEAAVALRPGYSLLLPPAVAPRRLTLRALTPGRLIRVVYGPGRGLVFGRPLERPFRAGR
ncbi:Quercetin 2,3-dioxygenase [bacterium HR25]|jgi:redox-sensitive bicupin YhaK (pirin superfamily)|nr:Quercetin 2,3-dioxygenase [bacterium HR25]